MCSQYIPLNVETWLPPRQTNIQYTVQFTSAPGYNGAANTIVTTLTNTFVNYYSSVSNQIATFPTAYAASNFTTYHAGLAVEFDNTKSNVISSVNGLVSDAYAQVNGIYQSWATISKSISLQVKQKLSANMRSCPSPLDSSINNIFSTGTTGMQSCASTENQNIQNLTSNTITPELSKIRSFISTLTNALSSCSTSTDVKTCVNNAVNFSL